MGDIAGKLPPSTVKALQQALVKAPLGSRRRQNTNLDRPLYLQQPSTNVVLVRPLRRKEESTWNHFASWFVENQVGLAFNLILLLFLAHLIIPRARHYTRKFFRLSYYNPQTEQYASGFNDAYMITFFIVLFTGVRAGCIEYILAPLAQLQGIKSRKVLMRFSEQAWLLVYYCIFWPMGVYIYCNSPNYLNLQGLWIDWPKREIDGLMKFYMLAQWGFWLQQFIVVNIEERRKDYWQMCCHHIITTVLISSCYCYHFTRVGSFILVIMDVVDLFLPLAKCLRYCGYKTLCDITFGIFMVIWLAARHVIYLTACWSIYAHAPEIIGSVCFVGPHDALVGPLETPSGWTYLLEPFSSSTGRVCFNQAVKWGFLGPLLVLQVITIFWFTMIVNIAAKVLRGQGADDSRSDNEEEEEEEEEDEEEEEEEDEDEEDDDGCCDENEVDAGVRDPVSLDAGVDSLYMQNWERRLGVKRLGITSGVNLPGHGDGKESLGRIGWERPADILDSLDAI